MKCIHDRSYMSNVMIHQHVPAKSITCLEISKLGPVCPLHKNTSRLPLKEHAGSIGTIQLHLGYCRSYFLRRHQSTPQRRCHWAAHLQLNLGGHEGHGRWNTNSELISSGWHTLETRNRTMKSRNASEPAENYAKKIFCRCFSLLKRRIFSWLC